jgi:adenylate cyclase
VIARNSSFAYKGRAVDIKQVGRELGVRYVVEGSVRKAGNRVRITAQLIEAGTGAHIWADRYERGLSDIFALQDDITQHVVAAIAPSLRALEIRRALAKPTENLRAYDFFLRALPEFHGQTEDSAKRAVALLRKAVELDPGYPEALGLLADTIATVTVNGWHENLLRGLEESLEMARRALAAGPENSTCLACAASTYVFLGRRFEEGLELAERALRLHPNSVFVRSRAGIAYVNCGESDKAIEHFEAAWRMNPQDPKALTFTGMCAAHFFARRFDECVAWGRRAVGEAAGATSPAGTWPRHSPILAASRKRARRSPRCSSASPTPRSPARGCRASATRGSTSSISRGCARPACRKRDAIGGRPIESSWRNRNADAARRLVPVRCGELLRGVARALPLSALLLQHLPQDGGRRRLRHQPVGRRRHARRQRPQGHQGLPRPDRRRRWRQL